MIALPNSRRSFAALLALVLACALVVPEASFGARSEVERLQAELNDINDDFKRAGKAFDKAFWSLDETEKKIEDTEARISANEEDLAVARTDFESRLNDWYRADDMGLLAFVIESKSIGDLVLRLEYANRIAENDAAVVERIEGALTELRADRERLTVEQKTHEDKVAKFRKERDALQQRLAGKRSEYNRVQAELAAAAEREAARKAATKQATSKPAAGASSVKSIPGPNGMVFPVAGPNYYSDTWGASRAGGRRRHKGTDIMAATGTPVVATMSGTVKKGDGATSGLYLRITADNGWQFYYMHLNSASVTSGRVEAGQVIGTVGYSGNASASAPHLHYEIHPNGGDAVNPYPYLRKMQGR